MLNTYGIRAMFAAAVHDATVCSECRQRSR